MREFKTDLMARMHVAIGILGIALANLLVYPSSWDQIFAVRPEERYGEIWFSAGDEIYIVARNEHELEVLIESGHVSKNITKKGRDYERTQSEEKRKILPGSEALVILPVSDPYVISGRRFSDGHSFISPPLNLVTPGKESKWIFLVVFLLAGCIVVALSADHLIMSAARFADQEND